MILLSIFDYFPCAYYIYFEHEAIVTFSWEKRRSGKLRNNEGSEANSFV